MGMRELPSSAGVIRSHQEIRTGGPRLRGPVEHPGAVCYNTSIWDQKGAAGLEDPRGYNSAEEYRAIQELVREGCHLEAIDRAQSALASGQAGRKHAARLHCLICQVCTEELRRPSPVAILHGEEAVRLAGMLRDPWIKCDALARLVQAYCETGDRARASAACEAIAVEVACNDAVIPGGLATLLVLKAQVAAAAEDWASALALFEQAEAVLAPEFRAIAVQIYAGKVRALLEQGSEAQLRSLLEHEVPQAAAGGDAGLLCKLARAWLALSAKDAGRARTLLGEVLDAAQGVRHMADRVEALVLNARLEELRNPPEALRMARQAHQRWLAMGRVDLARRLRRRLMHLL
jgi:hypothetical protein